MQKPPQRGGCKERQLRDANASQLREGRESLSTTRHSSENGANHSANASQLREASQSQTRQASKSQMSPASKSQLGAHNSSSVSFFNALRAMHWKASSTLMSSFAEVSKYGIVPLDAHQVFAFFSVTCPLRQNPLGDLLIAPKPSHPVAKCTHCHLKANSWRKRPYRLRPHNTKAV